MTSPEQRSDPPPRWRQRRLLRSRQDRVLGGVAGGLAEYFDVDPVIFRVGFVIGALISGLGIFAYLALLIAVPSDDGSGRAAQSTGWGRVAVGSGAILLALFALSDGALGLGWWLPSVLFWLGLAAGAGYLLYRWISRDREGPAPGADGAASPEAGDAAPAPAGEAASPRPTATTAEGATAETAVMPAGGEAPAARRAGRGATSALRALAWIALGTLALGAAAALMVASAWVTAEGAGAGVAALVCALGVILVVGALTGARATRWLVLPALLLALPLGAVAAADIELRGGYGDQAHRPASPSVIPDQGYEMAAGEMTVDMRGIEWRRGQRVELPIALGFGEVSVIVPDRVCVESRVEMTAGMIDLRGYESWGVGVEPETVPAPSPAPRLLLDAGVEGGYLQVLDQTEYARRDFDLDDHREWDDDQGEEEAQRTRAAAACKPTDPAPDGGRGGRQRGGRRAA